MIEDSLKEHIEKIIDEVLDHTIKRSGFKRIIITDLRPRTGISDSDMENINYTHNRFLNK